MPFPPAIRSRRDSWPPTQVRLDQTLSLDSDHSLDGIDDDPLTYFLTPAPAFENDDGDVNMLDFDAGIEDLNHPQEIVRSVSPSSLEGGLKRPSGRTLSPDRDISEVATPEDEDEEYIRFGNGGLGLPFHLRDFSIDGIKSKPKPYNKAAAPNELLRPASFHVPHARGRTPARGHGQGRTRSLSARRRPQHLWREPSPDVWSIEEETEEELHSDMDSSMIRSDEEDEGFTKNDVVEVSAAKPLKRVRFVLPVKD